MQKKKEVGKVHMQQNIADGIYDMWIETTLAQGANPGQFITVYPKDGATLLPRPISICEADKEKNLLRIVYRVAGKGTEEFSKFKSGHPISVLGVLGNGFPVEKAKGKKVFLMGGGIGIPPMLELAKQLAKANESAAEEDKTQIIIVVGYRNDQLFLSEDLAKYGEVYVATEDGSKGTKGNVMNAIEANGLEADLIYACGPMPMLRAIKTYADEKNMEAYISLEERMACGVGACLGCVCKTKEVDHHSHVHNARVCTDGPVYLAGEVEI